MDVLQITGREPDKVLLNDRLAAFPRGFDWVSPVRTDYYSLQCKTCTGWSHSGFGDECSTCMAVSLQKKWLEHHRSTHSEDALLEMVAAYRVDCETGDSDPVKEWCLTHYRNKIEPSS